MSIHENFAENLRMLCFEFGNIAAVCRASNTNRQQFNKYLAGKSVPNAKTLRRICDTLGVQEESLFQKQLSHRDIAGRAEHQPIRDGIFPGFPVSRVEAAGDEIPVGWYQCYFPLYGTTGKFVRSVLVVRRTSERTEFTRLTVFPSGQRISEPLVKGKHKGVVCKSGNQVFLVGVNVFPPYQMSLMTISREIGTRPDFFKGLALTKNYDVPISSKFCMMPLRPSETKRQVLTQLGIISETNGTLENIVLAGLLT